MSYSRGDREAATSLSDTKNPCKEFQMSRISYRKIDSENSKRLALLSLSEFLNELPKVTIDEIEGLAATNTHLVEQIPRYLSEMVSYECRLIGF